jgi:hypothetical protein
MQPQFQVSEGTLFGQYSYGVAIDDENRFVVTWSSYDGDLGYKGLARLYDAQGNPEGGEFAVDPSSTNAQYEGTVAKNAAGRFVVVWLEGNNELIGQGFEPDGTPLGDPFPINTSADPLDDHSVAADDAGNFVVSWTNFNTDDVMARLFDSSGAPRTGEIVVNAYTTDVQRARGLAISGSGFVVTWGGQGTGGPGIWARRFDSTGAPVTGDIKANADPLMFAISGSDVAMNRDGEFVVAWSGFVPPSFESVRVRRFDAAGAPLSGEIPVGNPAAANQGGAQIASDRAGNYIVAWTHQSGDGDQAGIVAQRFDRFDAPVSTAFVVNETTAGSQTGPRVALNDTATFVVTWDTPDASDSGVAGRRSGLRARELFADAANSLRSPESPSAAPDNGVLEPGESSPIRTIWVNDALALASPLTGTATSFTGPAGATHTLDDATAGYGMVGGAGSIADCLANTGDCYAVTVSAPPVRPIQHWDAQLQEALSAGVPKTWPIHIGESFPDVPTGNIFYAFIETLFHNGVTGGCAGGGYCPTNPVTRAQMAVFLLKSKFGAAHIPPPCTGIVFTDVPCTGGPFDPWIEELAGLQITGGCGGGLYCPNNTVTRQQMAVFLLKALEGSSYDPPDCIGRYDDVPCTPGTGFSDWIEELASRGITGGCSVTPPLYCPTNPNNRGQMAVFLVKTFGLVLYGG